MAMSSCSVLADTPSDGDYASPSTAAMMAGGGVVSCFGASGQLVGIGYCGLILGALLVIGYLVAACLHGDVGRHGPAKWLTGIRSSHSKRMRLSAYVWISALGLMALGIFGWASPVGLDAGFWVHERFRPLQINWTYGCECHALSCAAQNRKGEVRADGTSRGAYTVSCQHRYDGGRSAWPREQGGTYPLKQMYLPFDAARKGRGCRARNRWAVVVPQAAVARAMGSQAPTDKESYGPPRVGRLMVNCGQPGSQWKQVQWRLNLSMQMYYRRDLPPLWRVCDSRNRWEVLRPSTMDDFAFRPPSPSLRQAFAPSSVHPPGSGGAFYHFTLVFGAILFTF